MTSTTSIFFTGYSPPDPEVERVELLQISRDLGERYEVEGYLNKGGFATVWKARDRIAEIPLAVKRLNGSTKRPGDFYRELRAMFRLHHPNIVRLVNFLETESARYLILELCTGGSLRAAVSRANRRGEQFPEARVASIIRDIACGLAVAHAEGFSHRDIKPENVLFNGDSADAIGGTSAVKLTDFGLASLLRNRDDDQGLRSVTGSPAYMAPEQFHGSFDTASDIYALGVVAFELLHGTPPFVGTPESLALQHLREAPAFRSDLSELWLELLPRMLAKKSNERPTAAEVEALLEAAKPVTASALIARVARKTKHELAGALQSLQGYPDRNRFLAVTDQGFTVMWGDEIEAVVNLPGIRSVAVDRDGVNVAIRSGKAYSWNRAGGLTFVGTVPRDGIVFTGADHELRSCSHDGDRVEVRGVSSGRAIWSRSVNSGGLKPLVARNASGQIAAVECEGIPGIRFLDPEGRDIGWVPVPGLCWNLQESGDGPFTARVLTGRGFEALACGPLGCRAMRDSFGVAHYAADAHSTASAGVWPDGTVKWWASARSGPRTLTRRLKMEGFAGLAVNGRHVAFAETSGATATVRIEKMAMPSKGSEDR